jgi:hypothetical protein
MSVRFEHERAGMMRVFRVAEQAVNQVIRHDAAPDSRVVG